MSLSVFARSDKLSLSAESAILIEAESGEPLYTLDCDKRMGMASTTKIMTALTVLGLCDIGETVKISEGAVGIEGSSCYLQKGEKLTVEQLLYAVMLASANDAAAALAIYSAGSVEAFAALMNENADAMGMRDTHFTNPHGLYDDDHYTTARELAQITRAALKIDTFREICSTRRKVIPLCGDEGARTLVNHNKLLVRYDGAIGVKTGYTKACGRCLVSAAERDGMTLIAVTLNAPDDWNDHEKLLDYGFEGFTRRALTDASIFTVPVEGGAAGYVCAAADYVSAVLEKDGEELRSELSLPRFLYAPIKRGDKIGSVKFYRGETLIARADIRALTDVKRKSAGGMSELIRKIFGKK